MEFTVSSKAFCMAVKVCSCTTFRTRNLSGIERIRLYANNNYLYTSEPNNIIQLREVSDDDWYNTLFGQNERMWFAPADFKAFCMAVKVCSCTTFRTRR